MEQLSLLEFLILVAIGYLPTYLVFTPLVGVLLKQLCIVRKYRYWLLFIQIMFVFLFGLAVLTYCPWFNREIPSYLFIFDSSALFGELLSGLSLLVYAIIKRKNRSQTSGKM